MSEQELNHWQARCYALVDEKAGLEQQLAQARERLAHLETMAARGYGLLERWQQLFHQSVESYQFAGMTEEASLINDRDAFLAEYNGEP